MGMKILYSVFRVTPRIQRTIAAHRASHSCPSRHIDDAGLGYTFLNLLNIDQLFQSSTDPIGFILISLLNIRNEILSLFLQLHEGNISHNGPFANQYSTSDEACHFFNEMSRQ